MVYDCTKNIDSNGLILVATTMQLVEIDLY
jgi:hypothetical protein